MLAILVTYMYRKTGCVFFQAPKWEKDTTVVFGTVTAACRIAGERLRFHLSRFGQRRPEQDMQIEETVLVDEIATARLPRVSQRKGHETVLEDAVVIIIL